MARELDEYLDRFFGTDEWRAVITHADQVPNKLIPFLRKRLGTLGYATEEVKSVPIEASGLTLYHLVYVTKHDTGNQIWKAITRTAPGGQRDLFTQ